MIKSNSDHVLRVDKAAIKSSMANSSGNLIIACKRNSLCTCSENENHLNLLFNEEFDKNCTEHQTNENKKCKLTLDNFSLNEQNRDQSNTNNTNNTSNNQQNQNNDDQAMYNQQPNQPNQLNQQNNEQDNNENNEQNELNQHHQILNQMVDINNNIIEPELMVVDENNNLVGLPDANFDLNNNYLWQNRNADLEQQPNEDNQNDSNEQQQQQNQENSNQQHEHTSQLNNSVLKDKLNCSNQNLLKSNCTNSNCCKSTNQPVQLRQRKKLLELDLNKPKTGNQYYSTMKEEDVIKKEETSSSNLYLFKRSSSSGRRKKSIQCGKCLTKHLTKCDHNSRCEHSRYDLKNENIKCEHHSIDCQTPETELRNETAKKNFKKATTPLSLFPISAAIKEQLDNNESIENEIKNEIKQPNKSNLKDQISTNTSLISQQCPICLFTLNEPCKPNNCETHSFCKVCLIEWAKVSNECPLCRNPFSSILNKCGKQLECSINLQNERELSQSSLENILNLDDLNWPFIASAFLNNQTGQENLDQQCEQINNILNSMFGHLEPQNMDIQWPF